MLAACSAVLVTSPDSPPRHIFANDRDMGRYWNRYRGFAHAALLRIESPTSNECHRSGR